MEKNEIDTSVRFRVRKLTIYHMSLPKYAHVIKLKINNNKKLNLQKKKKKKKN